MNNLVFTHPDNDTKKDHIQFSKFFFFYFVFFSCLWAAVFDNLFCVNWALGFTLQNTRSDTRHPYSRQAEREGGGGAITPSFLLSN